MIGGKPPASIDTSWDLPLRDNPPESAKAASEGSDGRAGKDLQNEQ
jgi:hypothetical protein